MAIVAALAVATGACGVSPDGAAWVLDPPHGTASDDAPIIDGTACTPEEHPTAVAVLIDAVIELQGFGQQPIKTIVCTGTLIAPDVVLTAAHCLDPTALTFGLGTVVEERYAVTWTSDLTALAEGRTTTFPADAVNVAAWLAHPNFDLQAIDPNIPGPGAYDDIGLLFLDQALERQPAVVIQPDEVDQLQVGAPVDIVGWGQQEPSSTLFPPPGTVGAKHCASTTINELGSNEMQIGDTGPRKCHGDSGGPTYLEVETSSTITRRVIGVTSRAYDTTDCAKGGIDTRVDAQLSWMETEMVAACQAGTRAWCEVEGIVPASFYDLPGTGGSGGAGGAGGGGGGTGGGAGGAGGTGGGAGGTGGGAGGGAGSTGGGGSGATGGGSGGGAAGGAGGGDGGGNTGGSSSGGCHASGDPLPAWPLALVLGVLWRRRRAS